MCTTNAIRKIKQLGRAHPNGVIERASESGRQDIIQEAEKARSQSSGKAAYSDRGVTETTRAEGNRIV